MRRRKSSSKVEARGGDARAKRWKVPRAAYTSGADESSRSWSNATGKTLSAATAEQCRDIESSASRRARGGVATRETRGRCRLAAAAASYESAGTSLPLRRRARGFAFIHARIEYRSSIHSFQLDRRRYEWNKVSGDVTYLLK